MNKRELLEALKDVADDTQIVMPGPDNGEYGYEFGTNIEIRVLEKLNGFPGPHLVMGHNGTDGKFIADRSN